ncbi:hypothetical protein TAMA11512_05730 [Selenomonas sp. TAMA-11512]|uniref:hypothetical protein n=1 Tax=Selenomonas sp. TAMA-11512 TaxID=3095337 RepID=UPI00309346B0|nr:hypothetical protein TAMA11512_05730 [Selenomonas sp. TAMA-11512]
MRSIQTFLFAAWLCCAFALLPGGLAYAETDLTQTNLRYTSTDEQNVEKSYTLQLDRQPPKGISTRYILKEESDRGEWTGFTYDASNGMFMMYHPKHDNGNKPFICHYLTGTGGFVYYPIRDDGLVDYPAGHAFVKRGDGRYYPVTDPSEPPAIKYITDGMELFLSEVKR